MKTLNIGEYVVKEINMGEFMDLQKSGTDDIQYKMTALAVSKNGVALTVPELRALPLSIGVQLLNATLELNNVSGEQGND